MPSDDIAISVKAVDEELSSVRSPGGSCQAVLEPWAQALPSEFTALSDVSFDIRKGETVGIIGRNGSGKSTLLQLICGILKPTAGVIQVQGRIAALLELGSGFNPEFTGRENVYFQGALMGLTRRR